MDDAEKPDPAAMLDALGRMPDDDLRELVKRGQAILAAREQERRREAVKEIERLAKAHGLKVDVGEKRRRGRPPSKEGKAQP
jgi:hypothetical protein